jgi:hypothetical protein
VVLPPPTLNGHLEQASAWADPALPSAKPVAATKAVEANAIFLRISIPSIPSMVGGADVPPGRTIPSAPVPEPRGVRGDDIKRL